MAEVPPVKTILLDCGNPVIDQAYEWVGDRWVFAPFCARDTSPVDYRYIGTADKAGFPEVSGYSSQLVVEMSDEHYAACCSMANTRRAEP